MKSTNSMGTRKSGLQKIASGSGTLSSKGESARISKALAANIYSVRVQHQRYF